MTLDGLHEYIKIKRNNNFKKKYDKLYARSKV